MERPPRNNLGNELFFVGEAHRHADLSPETDGEADILVQQAQREIGRVVFLLVGLEHRSDARGIGGAEFTSDPAGRLLPSLTWRADQSRFYLAVGAGRWRSGRTG